MVTTAVPAPRSSRHTVEVYVLVRSPARVLIGPNGSGKSNLVDALRFIDSFAWKGGKLDDQVEVRGGWTELIWGGRSDSELEVGVEFEQEADFRVTYSAAIQTLDNGDAVTDTESLVVNGGTPWIERRTCFTPHWGSDRS